MYCIHMCMSHFRNNRSALSMREAEEYVMKEENKVILIVTGKELGKCNAKREKGLKVKKEETENIR